MSTHVAVNSEVPILESSNPNWQGPVSLSLSFFSGDYVNASVEKGVPNYEVSEAVKQCRGLLKKGAKKGAEAQGFTIGWSDSADNSGGYIQFPSILSSAKEAESILRQIEEFIKSAAPKKNEAR